MGFGDIFKNSFIASYSAADISGVHVITCITITAILALYVFMIYKLMTRKTFYSKNFNISLVAIAIITAGIIMTIQSSIVVSLGMVGALSIVRFRTAIKEPLDLVFLFWSISIGIMCGADLSKVAIITSLLLTIILCGLSYFPNAKMPMVLIVNAELSESQSQNILEVVGKYSKYYKVKSRNITNNQLDLVVEVSTKEDEAFTKELSELSGVRSVSLLSHDGEVTF